jgi:hypothetical protein
MIWADWLLVAIAAMLLVAGMVIVSWQEARPNADWIFIGKVAVIVAAIVVAALAWF